MKLKFFVDKNKKIYTLKKTIHNSKEKTPTKDAHYKYVKMKNKQNS